MPFRLAPFFALCTLLACGKAVDTGDEPIDCAEAPTVTWNNWGDGFFHTWCQSCHSAETSDRNGAPEGVNFDLESDVIAQQDLVRWAVLETGFMPLGGGLDSDTSLLLEIYLDCTLAD